MLEDEHTKHGTLVAQWSRAEQPGDLLKESEGLTIMLGIVLRCTKQTIILPLTTFNSFTSEHTVNINTEASTSPVNAGKTSTEATEVSQIGWN